MLNLRLKRAEFASVTPVSSQRAPEICTIMRSVSGLRSLCAKLVAQLPRAIFGTREQWTTEVDAFTDSVMNQDADAAEHLIRHRAEGSHYATRTAKRPSMAGLVSDAWSRLSNEVAIEALLRNIRPIGHPHDLPSNPTDDARWLATSAGECAESEMEVFVRIAAFACLTLVHCAGAPLEECTAAACCLHALEDGELLLHEKLSAQCEAAVREAVEIVRCHDMQLLRACPSGCGPMYRGRGVYAASALFHGSQSTCHGATNGTLLCLDKRHGSSGSESANGMRSRLCRPLSSKGWQSRHRCGACRNADRNMTDVSRNAAKALSEASDVLRTARMVIAASKAETSNKCGGVQHSAPVSIAGLSSLEPPKACAWSFRPPGVCGLAVAIGGVHPPQSPSAPRIVLPRRSSAGKHTGALAGRKRQRADDAGKLGGAKGSVVTARVARNGGLCAVCGVAGAVARHPVACLSDILLCLACLERLNRRERGVDLAGRPLTCFVCGVAGALEDRVPRGAHAGPTHLLVGCATCGLAHCSSCRARFACNEPLLASLPTSTSILGGCTHCTEAGDATRGQHTKRPRCIACGR